MTTPTEYECETTIIEAAKLGGWLVHAERPARSNRGWRTPIRGDAGWPDLVLVGHGRVVVLELKRRPNQVTDDQGRWLEALRRAMVDARVVYVPDELDALVAELVTGCTNARYQPTPKDRP